MAAPAELHVFKDSLVLLSVAGLLVPLMHKLKINAILSFLLAGAVFGPYGLGKLAGDIPLLSHFTVSRTEGLSLLGDLGVVFLLFLIGMELSFQRLITMRKLVFGLGGIQFISCTAAIAGALLLLKFEPLHALVIGSALALSSTAIVIQFLSRQKRLNSSTGRASFSILLFQDLAVIPVLFFLGILGARQDTSIAAGAVMALLEAALSVGLIFVAGRLILRPIFRLVASTESAELFVATTLLVVLGAAVTASSLGASMALGAFVAGLLIAETEYSRAIGAVLDPFKGLLLGVFFFTVGMGLDPAYIISNPLPLAAALFALLAIKGLLVFPAVKLSGFSWQTSLKTALLLAPAGEFAFVILGLAAVSGVLTKSESELALSTATLTMALIPFMGFLGDKAAARFSNKSAPAPARPASGETDGLEALVIGLRRVGSMACEMLQKQNVRYLAIDRDPVMVESLRSKGFPAYFGNGADPLVLHQCGIMAVKVVLVTSHDRSEIDDVVKTVMALRKDVILIARAHDTDHAQRLYEQGVAVAVLETMEASLQLSEAALLKLARDEQAVLGTINAAREKVRSELLAAAGQKS